MTFEITVASVDDVQRMARWAADEGWNPGNTDAYAFHTTDPGAFLIGRLDGEPIASINVTRFGAGSASSAATSRGRRRAARVTASRSGTPA